MNVAILWVPKCEMILRWTLDKNSWDFNVLAWRKRDKGSRSSFWAIEFRQLSDPPHVPSSINHAFALHFHIHAVLEANEIRSPHTRLAVVLPVFRGENIAINLNRDIFQEPGLNRQHWDVDPTRNENNSVPTHACIGCCDDLLHCSRVHLLLLNWGVQT